jgi:serine/threonine protein phosphatase 1
MGLLDRWRKSVPDAPARRAPDGVRLYAIGDVHGRLDLFEALLERLAADHAARPGPAAHLVLLGDYIDRGPQSAQLLDRLANGPPPWATWTLLRGNHEQVLLDLYIGRDGFARRLAGWLDFGGRETLRSYGLPSSVAFGDNLEAIGAEIQRLVPARHLALIQSMPLTWRMGDYLFVHAGLKPGLEVEYQQGHDLLWIREEFLDSDADHGALVVHGHSITARVDIRTNRIGIDTGAYATGRLTALVLEGEARRFLSTLDRI